MAGQEALTCLSLRSLAKDSTCFFMRRASCFLFRVNMAAKKAGRRGADKWFVVRSKTYKMWLFLIQLAVVNFATGFSCSDV